jgi:hypothetical protein
MSELALMLQGKSTKDAAGGGGGSESSRADASGGESIGGQQPQQPSLPEGWTEHWSRSRACYYYRNASTGQVRPPALDFRV